jgi:hypothetical protein
LVEFFVKTFRHDFFIFLNVFCSVFELPSLKNTRKCDKTKKVEEKLTSKFLSKFWGKVFDTDFLPKYFYCVFELPLPRNAQKRTKKKSQGKKKSDGGWVGLRFSKCTGGSVDFFFGGPSPRSWELGVRCVMKQWPATHLLPIGVPCCQRSPTIPEKKQPLLSLLGLWALCGRLFFAFRFSGVFWRLEPPLKAIANCAD